MRSTMRFGPVFTYLLVIVLSVVGACGGGGRSSDLIAGSITATKDGGTLPVARAQVMVRPTSVDPEKKGADEQMEDPANLRGVSITNDAGYFEISALSSDQTFTEYGLLRNWKYEITIQVPGYYIYKGTFSYEKGGQELAIALEEKGADVIDSEGVIEIPEGSIQQGAVRRGN